MATEITQKRYDVKRNCVLPRLTHPRLMRGMAFGARIKAVREELGLTQETVVDRVRALGGDAARFSQSTLKDTENRDSRKSAYASSICHVLGIHLLWALMEQGPKWLDEMPSIQPETPLSASVIGNSNIETLSLPPSDLVYVDKVVGAHLAAGSGEIVYDFDHVEKSHSFRSDWMQEKRLRPERCKVWSVRGDSMEPRYSSGDIVLIDMSDREPRHGKVFALVGDDGLRIKQLRRGAAGWEMYSFNPDQSKYPPEPIVSDNYAIIGRVRWHAGDED